jgi:hypothetical protein
LEKIQIEADFFKMAFLSIIYSNSNSHSYGIAKSLKIAVAKAKVFPKPQLQAKLKTNSIPEDWTGQTIANCWLVGHSYWDIMCLYQEIFLQNIKNFLEFFLQASRVFS